MKVDIKIALLGNTCNNNFAIMRYFRCLGVDAHLLLYSNDGVEGLASINNPEWDTWDFAKWAPFVKILPFPNSLESVIGRPDLFRPAPSRFSINEAIKGFDYYIGSGMSAAIFARVERSLSIFYPYSTGVEWVGDEECSKKLRTYNLEWPFRVFVKSLQIKGIRSATSVICGTLGSSSNILSKYGINFIPLKAPQIYNLEEVPYNVESESITYLLSKIYGSHIVVFSHMRHHWVCGKSYEPLTWFQENKNNQWLITGFYSFIKRFPESNAKLVLVDWGKDAEASKGLCCKLGIQESIVWLPLLKRKEIFWILKNACTIAVGDFVSCPGQYWGSAAFEALSVGIPVMQSVNISDSDLLDIFDHPLPYFLDVRSSEDVFVHLKNIFLDYDDIIFNSRQNQEWFVNYNGLGLAKKWLDIIVGAARKGLDDPKA